MHDGKATWRRILAFSFIAQVLSIMGFSFALPFMPFFIRELGITDPSDQVWWAGVSMAASGITLAIFAPLWGILADRHGRKVMVLRSMAGGTAVLILMSLSRNITDLVICRLLQGVFTGTIAASIALVASVTPEKKSGMALGIMQAAVFMGTAIGPLTGGLVADAYGYRTAFRIGAVIILLGAVLVYYGTDEEFCPNEKKDADIKINFLNLIKSKEFFSAMIILLAVRFANTIVNPSFPLIISNILPSGDSLNRTAGTIMGISGIAGALSAVLLGYVGDRAGHFRIITLCCIGTAVTASLHYAAYTIPFLTAVHVLFGFTIAGIMPAANSLIKGTVGTGDVGKAFGFASAISMLGLALGPLAGGIIAQRFGVRAPFLTAAVCQVSVVVIMIKLRLRIRSVNHY